VRDLKQQIAVSCRNIEHTSCLDDFDSQPEMARRLIALV